MPDSLSRTFAQFVSPMSYGSLPPAVVDKIKASVLHAMVTGIIGADTTHGQAAIHLAKSEEGKPDGATILVDGGKATRCGAAFAFPPSTRVFDPSIFAIIFGAVIVLAVMKRILRRYLRDLI